MARKYKTDKQSDWDTIEYERANMERRSKSYPQRTKNDVHDDFQEVGAVSFDVFRNIFLFFSHFLHNTYCTYKAQAVYYKYGKEKTQH